MKTEKYFTWREYAQLEGEDSPRLLIPFPDDVHQFTFDFLYESREEALQGLKDYELEDIAKDWVLCKMTVEPVSKDLTKPDKVEVVLRFWACDDPEKPREGMCYDTLRPAVAGARLRNQYVVVEAYEFRESTVVKKPRPKEEESS